MIRTFVLENFGPFRGRHVVHLEAKAYAVTARYEADPGRSNWGGKSMLIEAIDFALTGRLKKSRRITADGWITNGEKSGLVGILFVDGAAVMRSRRRGLATQARFALSGVTTEVDFQVAMPNESSWHGCATQDEASAAVLKYLCFDADDFRFAAYFESKQAARLVHTEPGTREEIVSGWLGTRRAEAAEDLAASEAAEMAAEVQKKREVLRVYSEQREALSRERIDAEQGVLASQVEEAEAAHKKLMALLRQARAFATEAATVREYERLVEQGKTLAAEVDAFDPQLPQQLQDAESAKEKAIRVVAEASAEVERRRIVAKGKFDGRCPIADIECPARAAINEGREASASAFERARAVLEAAEKKRTASTDAVRKLQAVDYEAKQKKSALTDARARAKYLLDNGVKEAIERTKAGSQLDADLLEEKVEAVRSRLEEAKRQMSANNATLDSIRRLELNIEAAEEGIQKASAVVRVALRGRAVLRSALRRVSEGALAAIGADASATLLNAGVDLRVEVRWDYEGKDLAKSCEECGAAFVASAKVKQCASCGAPRGMHVIRRLEFLRSDQSDAADDLAGIALQLAAGSWLLTRRESPWATALLDEPLAACDRTNRKAFAHALVSLLDTGSWRQSLTISHSGDTVDAFPARIEIVVGRDGERRIDVL